MRMMLIYFGAAVGAYFLSGMRGRFSKRDRLYFAIGAFVLAYLVAMVMTFIEGGL